MSDADKLQRLIDTFQQAGVIDEDLRLASDARDRTHALSATGKHPKAGVDLKTADLDVSLHTLIAGLASPNDVSFTEAQVRMLSPLVRGLSNKGIARDIGISEATVKVHMKALLKEVGAQNRTQAAVWIAYHLVFTAR